MVLWELCGFPHCLLYRLAPFFSGNTLYSFNMSSFVLSERSQMVMLVLYESAKAMIHQGVPQSSHLSHTCFNPYFASLAQLVQSFDCSKSYADEKQLVCPISCQISSTFVKREQSSVREDYASYSPESHGAGLIYHQCSKTC